MATYAQLEFEWSMLEDDYMYWDNTDLQLAAELGKTLLERNKELEASVRHHQSVIDDQAQEIEYLSKQTAALREVNDSRLRIYEQLEVSIQELEKTNQRLATENSNDKARIKGLCQNIDLLEAKCDDLQRAVDDHRAAEVQRRLRESRKTEETTVRKVVSAEPDVQKVTDDEDDRQAEIARLHSQLMDLRDLQQTELRRRRDLEMEVMALSEENKLLQEQLTVIQQKELKLHSLAEEVQSLDEVREGKLCGRCLSRTESDDESPVKKTLDLARTVENNDPRIESVHGEVALVKLNNGGLAWGSQESLVSLGQIVEPKPTSPPEWSFSNLDAQYRLLIDEIDKYENLLARRRHPPSTPPMRPPTALSRSQAVLLQSAARSKSSTDSHDSLSLMEEIALSRDYETSGYDEKSGPMSLLFTCSAGHDRKPVTGLLSSRKGDCISPGVRIDELSETETSSSGFSDGDTRCCSRGVQTDVDVLVDDPGFISVSCDDDPVEGHFEHTPEYKKLFKEIFSVLKNSKMFEEAEEQPGDVTDVVSYSEPASISDSFKRECNDMEVTEVDTTGGVKLPVHSSDLISRSSVSPFREPTESHKRSLSPVFQLAGSPDVKAFRSSASLGVAKLWKLEKSYAEALKVPRAARRHRVSLPSTAMF